MKCVRHVLNKQASEAPPVCPRDTERICSYLSSDIVYRMSQGQAGPPLHILWPFRNYDNYILLVKIACRRLSELYGLPAINSEDTYSCY